MCKNWDLRNLMWTLLSLERPAPRPGAMLAMVLALVILTVVSSLPGSCGPIRPPWRAARAGCWSRWPFFAVGGMLIFGLRFLPSVLPVCRPCDHGADARALRNPPSGGFSSPGTGQRTEVRTAFLQTWIGHGTGDVGGTMLAGRFSGCPGPPLRQRAAGTA